MGAIKGKIIYVRLQSAISSMISVRLRERPTINSCIHEICAKCAKKVLHLRIPEFLYVNTTPREGM